jgi:putative ABC transport system substrate-binding protein
VHGQIPLIFAGGFDAIGIGIVDRLAKRSENVTGTTAVVNELVAKRLQLLKDLVPSLSHVALIVNPKTGYLTERDLSEANATGKHLQLLISRYDIAEAQDVDVTFGNARRDNCDGVILSQTPYFALIRSELASAALSARLPMMTFSDTFVSAGALVSYGGSLRQVFRSAGKLVHRVLSGEKAADIPVTQPTALELALNLRTADALGLTIPTTVLGRADRVIE